MQQIFKKLEKYILPRSFYARQTKKVAQELLGKFLVRKIDEQFLVGKIVETECYTKSDPASHCYIGKTERNSAMFGPVGHAYIYFTYGNHYCINAVSRDKKTEAGGVLIRALEPVYGIEQMMKNRHKKNIKDLTNGPGKLTQALKINKKFNHYDLTKNGELMIIDLSKEQIEIVKSKRIGISKAACALLRFFIKDNPFVSR
ncbi:DNA-3-methyladenine glycosylase [Candidatus Dependentiae bacterium]|nr:DNA-3-methyladenine glycosylase [Candidatus Dependentiae bacterium]